MGGPDGGDGGTGGDVWLAVDHNISSLIAVKDHPHRSAESGTHGKGKGKHGHGGEDQDGILLSTSSQGVTLPPR